MRVFAVIDTLIYEVDGTLQDDYSFRCLRGPTKYIVAGWIVPSNDWFVVKDSAYNRLEVKVKRIIENYEDTLSKVDKNDDFTKGYYVKVIEDLEEQLPKIRQMDELFLKRMDK